MNNPTSALYLIPRFLGTLLVLFIFAFVFEITAEEFNLKILFTAAWPGLMILVLLITAWTKEGIGGWLFIILGIIGILYPFAIAKEFNWGFMILPGWAIIVGLLFLMSKKSKI